MARRLLYFSSSFLVTDATLPCGEKTCQTLTLDNSHSEGAIFDQSQGREAQMKRCVDCKLFQPDADAIHVSQCAHTLNAEPDFVNGGTKPEYVTANALRTTSARCGPEGKWWEERT